MFENMTQTLNTWIQFLYRKGWWINPHLSLTFHAHKSWWSMMLVVIMMCWMSIGRRWHWVVSILPTGEEGLGDLTLQIPHKSSTMVQRLDCILVHSEKAAATFSLLEAIRLRFLLASFKVTLFLDSSSTFSLRHLNSACMSPQLNPTCLNSFSVQLSVICFSTMAVFSAILWLYDFISVTSNKTSQNLHKSIHDAISVSYIMRLFLSMILSMSLRSPSN